MTALANHIGGRAVAAADGQTLDNVNPAVGEAHGTLPRSGAADVQAAVSAAHAALAGPWAGWSTADRAALCERVADVLASRTEALARAESADSGKPIALAARMDIPRSIANFRFFAGAALHSSTRFTEIAGAYSYTLRRPLGVVGLITPWNLPLYLLSWKVAPALVMGNTVVAKPSELTPTTASMLAEALAEAGAPAGVFNVVHGLGSEAGAALIDAPCVSAISFTGGTATGALVGAAAGRTHKKLSLELGGKNATILFDDCDLDDAIAGAVRAAFTNQGQVCLCGSRLLVQRGIYDEVVARVIAATERLTIGDPRSDVDLGALSSLAHRDKVERYLALARADGGALHGGERPALAAPFSGGAFLRPAVITGLAPTSAAACEEIFGPVLTVHPFDDEHEAVAIANGTAYGLAASVWTRDLDRTHRMANRLDVGMVWVNCWLVRDLRVPFGGAKASGVGREGGEQSLAFYSHDRNVTFARR